jgi:hypothetical protein
MRLPVRGNVLQLLVFEQPHAADELCLGFPEEVINGRDTSESREGLDVREQFRPKARFHDAFEVTRLMPSDDVRNQRPADALRSGAVKAKAAVSHVHDERIITALPGNGETERHVHLDSPLVQRLRRLLAVIVGAVLHRISLTGPEQACERGRRIQPAA